MPEFNGDQEARLAADRADQAEQELVLLEERPAALAEKKLLLKERLKAIDRQLKDHPAQLAAAREKAEKLRRIATAHLGK